MGRYICCGEDLVWKYALGEQPSEMYRIHEELGIGEYTFNEEGDTLILRRSDLELLDRALRELKLTQTQSQNYFLDMIDAICDYMREHPDRGEF